MPFLMPLQCSLYRGGQIRHFGMNFSKFFSRSLSTRDGLLTLPNDDLAGFIPSMCVFARIFVPTDPFMPGKKCPFLCLYSALYITGGGLYKAFLGEFFEVFFLVPFALKMDSLPSGRVN